MEPGDPPADDLSRFQGAGDLAHRGGRFALGRTADSYAIWSLESGGEPVRVFPKTTEGWGQAWEAFQELEGAPPAGPVEFARGRPARLRQMRVGQILEAAVAVYRLNAAALLSLMALVIVPYIVVQYAVLQGAVTQVEVAGEVVFESEAALDAYTAITAAFSFVYFVFVTPLLTGAVVEVAARAHLGQTPTAGEALRAALPMFPALLLVTVLVSLAVMGGTILLIIPGIILLVRLIFAPAVVMLEGRRGRQALRRSWELSRTLGWKIFGTVLLAGLLAAVVAVVIALPLGLAGAALGGFAGAGWVLSALGEMLATMVTTPFTTLVVVMLYLDARVRKERLDIQHMAEEVGTPPPSEAI